MIGLLLTLLCFLPGDVRLPMETVTLPTVPESVQRPVEAIRPDEWYIVEADGPQLCWVSFDECLEVEALAGPMTFRGRFAGGKAVETRTFPGPYIFAVTGVKPGKGELTLAPVGVLEIADVVRQVLTVSGAGPNPPPEPDPIPPGPEPPIPGDSNRVLIVYESSQLSSLPPAQSVLMSSANVRDYLRKKCSLGPDGKTPEFRIWDKDVDASNVSQVWKDAMAMPRTAVPWIVVSNGKTGFAGPLPADEATLLTLLKKYLGE